MMKKILFTIAAIALLSSAACGQTTPTVDPAQIQASAVAAANTMVALTQAAIPTATEIPPSPFPSPTELPSPTPFTMPTLDTTFPTAAAPISTSSGDPCNQAMAAKPAGPKTPLHIINRNKGPVNLSLWLAKTPFGECGFARLSPIPKSGSADYLLPSGCYFPQGYSLDPKHPSTPSGPTFCTKGSLKQTLFINADNFTFSP